MLNYHVMKQTSCLVCCHTAANFLCCTPVLHTTTLQQMMRTKRQQQLRPGECLWASADGDQSDKHQRVTLGQKRRCMLLCSSVLSQRINPYSRLLPYSLSPTCQSPTLLSPCSPCSPCSPLQTLHPWR